jgi:protein-S-isoprenylcysteine O-methyltransferase Ste14
VTTVVFALSCNPIYVGFAAVLIGEFLALAKWFLLVYLTARVLLFHRQVLREEDATRQHHGRVCVDDSR